MREWRDRVAAFLQDRLRLALRPGPAQPCPVRDGWVMTVRWCGRRLARPRGFAAQYRALLRHAGHECLIFFPVGHRVEFYGPQRLVAESVLSLNRAQIPRAGYALTAGFPRGATARYARRVLRAGVAVLQVGSGGGEARVPMALLTPCRTATGEPRAAAVSPASRSCRCSRRLQPATQSVC